MSEFIEVNGIKIPMTTPDDTDAMLAEGKYPLRVLLYGKSGSGKSTMASKFPGVKGVIDTDNGGIVYKGDVVKYSIPEDSIIGKAENLLKSQ